METPFCAVDLTVFGLWFVFWCVTPRGGDFNYIVALHSRPNCYLEIAQLAQVTEEIWSENQSGNIRRINKDIRYAVDNCIRKNIPKLDKESVRLVGLADSSFANNIDLSTQLGYVIFLCDKHSASVLSP